MNSGPYAAIRTPEDLLRAERALARAVRARDVDEELRLSYEIGSFLSIDTPRTQDAERGYRLLSRALELAQVRNDPEKLADVQINLASNRYFDPRGDQIDNKTEAVELVRKARQFYTRSRDPEIWAMCATNEALCLLFLDSADNTRCATKLLEEARRIRERGTVNWAYTSFNLGIAYRKYPADTVGEHRRYLERSVRALKAASLIYTANTMPEQAMRAGIQQARSEVRAIRLAVQTKDLTALHVAADDTQYDPDTVSLSEFDSEARRLDLSYTSPSFMGLSMANIDSRAVHDEERTRFESVAGDLTKLRATAVQLGRLREAARCNVLNAEIERHLNGATRRELALLQEALGSVRIDELASEWVAWAARALGVACELGDFEAGSVIARLCYHWIRRRVGDSNLRRAPKHDAPELHDINSVGRRLLDDGQRHARSS